MNCPYPDCGATIDSAAQFCPICGRSVKAKEAAGTEPSATPHQGSASASTSVAVEPRPAAKVTKLERRYGALRTIAGIYQVVAILVLIVAGIGAIWTFQVSIEASRGFFGNSSDAELQAFLSAAGVFLAGFVVFLLLCATGEAIRVVIDIEENTRATRKILERQP